MFKDIKKIKILGIIDHLDGGGAERQFINLFNNLNRELFDVYVLITEKKGRRFDELASDIKIIGLLNSNKRNTPKALMYLRNYINKIKPHIIQTWLDYSTFLTAFILNTTKTKVQLIASQQGSFNKIYRQEVSFGAIKRRLLIWAYKKARVLTTVCQSLKEELERYKLNNIEVIPIGLDLSLYRNLPDKNQLRQALKLEPDYFYLIFCGSLVERKGVLQLLRAFKSLNNSYCKLLLLGEGYLRPVIERIIRDSNNIELIGYKSNAAEYIKASDVLILPSLHEGLPNVIVEAMAVGTPVIATNIYGIPELLGYGKGGILIEPNNSEEIKNAIEYVINNQEKIKILATYSLENVEKYELNRMVQAYENLYLRVIHENPSSYL